MVLILACFTSLASSVEEAKSWEPPLEADVVWIKFNYEAGYSNDALAIVKNASTVIDVPEWLPPSRNNPFAYIKSQTNRRITVNFWHNQGPADICNIHVSMPGAIGYYPGLIAESVVNFPSCGESGSALLTMTGTVTNGVQHFGFYIQFRVTNVNGVALNPFITTGICGPHMYYVLLGAPQAPMAVPWTDVLDYSCAWAQYKSNESDAVRKITEKAYTSFGKNYWGSGTHAPGTTLHLTSLFASSWADCRDMSAVVHIFTRALGGSQTNVRMINSTTYGYEDFKYKSIDPVGSPSWTTGWWNFHQVANLSAVYDACLRLNQSSPRIPVGEDINGSYKNDLFDPVPGSVWAPKDSLSYQTVD